MIAYFYTFLYAIIVLLSYVFKYLPIPKNFDMLKTQFLIHITTYVFGLLIILPFIF